MFLISNISKPEQPLSPRNQNLFLIILFSPIVPLFFQLSLLKTTVSFHSLSFLLTTSSCSPILINSYCSKYLLASIFAFFIASVTFLTVTSPNLLQLVSMLSGSLTMPLGTGRIFLRTLMSLYHSLILWVKIKSFYYMSSPQNYHSLENVTRN